MDFYHDWTISTILHHGGLEKERAVLYGNVFITDVEISVGDGSLLLTSAL